MTYFRTLSQNSSEFVLFLSNFEELLSERKASLSPITGDLQSTIQRDRNVFTKVIEWVS